MKDCKWLIGFLFLLAVPGVDAYADDARNGATSATRDANQYVLEELPFDDVMDYELADRGFIGRKDSLVIRADSGRPRNLWAFVDIAFQTMERSAV